MSHLITDLNQLTPKRLTEIFRANGVLERGDVTGIAHELHPRTMLQSVVWCRRHHDTIRPLSTA